MSHGPESGSNEPLPTLSPRLATEMSLALRSEALAGAQAELARAQQTYACLPGEFSHFIIQSETPEQVAIINDLSPTLPGTLAVVRNHIVTEIEGGEKYSWLRAAAWIYGSNGISFHEDYLRHDSAYEPTEISWEAPTIKATQNSMHLTLDAEHLHSPSAFVPIGSARVDQYHAEQLDMLLELHRVLQSCTDATRNPSITTYIV